MSLAKGFWPRIDLIAFDIAGTFFASPNVTNLNSSQENRAMWYLTLIITRWHKLRVQKPLRLIITHLVHFTLIAFYSWNYLIFILLICTKLFEIECRPIWLCIAFKIECPKIPLCVICVHSYTNILWILYSYTTPSKFGEKSRHLCILDEGIIRHLPRKCFIYGDATLGC